MAQTFDINEPTTDSPFGTLHERLRNNFTALVSSHSGTAFPSSPVAGQLCWRTDLLKLYVYNTDATWDEIAIDSIGIGQEVVEARGQHTTLDNRLDIALNEDGTLRAATSLSPSQWYNWSGEHNPFSYLSTSSFEVSGEDATAIYRANRRLKINRTAGTYYTSVASSSYASGDTTVVTRDAVVNTDIETVEHSIVAPVRASYGDGAVSFEMVANLQSSSGGGTLNPGDSVIFANGTGTTTLRAITDYGSGRPIFLVNIHATQSHTFAAYSGQTINGAASITVLAGQSVIIVNNGTAWYRLDVPVSLVTATWTNISSFGTNWANFDVFTSSCFKDPFGLVHLKGAIISTGTSNTIATLPASHFPAQAVIANCFWDESASAYSHIYIDTSGVIKRLPDVGGMVSSGDTVFLDVISPFKAA